MCIYSQLAFEEFRSQTGLKHFFNKKIKKQANKNKQNLSLPKLELTLIFIFFFVETNLHCLCWFWLLFFQVSKITKGPPSYHDSMHHSSMKFIVQSSQIGTLLDILCHRKISVLYSSLQTHLQYKLSDIYAYVTFKLLEKTSY